jgi:hypothetical protein
VGIWYFTNRNRIYSQTDFSIWTREVEVWGAQHECGKINILNIAGRSYVGLIHEYEKFMMRTIT